MALVCCPKCDSRVKYIRFGKRIILTCSKKTCPNFGVDLEDPD